MRKMTTTVATIALVAVLSACGESSTAIETVREPAETHEAETVEDADAWKEGALYPYNKHINRFINDWNTAFPEDPIIFAEPYYHHGRTHDDMAEAKTATYSITIYGAYSGTEPDEENYRASVYYAAIYDDLGDAETNYLIFSRSLKILRPTLTDEEISSRWQEVCASGMSANVKWDDGTKFEGYAGMRDETQGLWEYYKVIG